VGLAAHSGQVDIRITVKAESQQEAFLMIRELENEIRNRIGKWIYGADQETLEDAAMQVLVNKSWKLSIVEAGLHGELASRLSQMTQVFMGGQILTVLPDPDCFENVVNDYRTQNSVEVCLGVAIYPQKEKQDILIVLITPTGVQKYNRPFGGPPQYTTRWAINHSLNIIRNV
jgi:hypothetical protein